MSNGSTATASTPAPWKHPKTEEVYDTDLRSVLFIEGINMPFSQAQSASGESDVLTDLETDDPLRSSAS